MMNNVYLILFCDHDRLAYCFVKVQNVDKSKLRNSEGDLYSLRQVAFTIWGSRRQGWL